ncbi:MAG: FliM/FliN family flagellar motor switch protein [Phycisphaerales bacterium]|nr:FliM/FliN family flagellar motor switch protein [Phycisphaerales bacterium]MCB9835402.1 FliM/FliN family flagellar motor switch protein [Phycisphaera sp.]
MAHKLDAILKLEVPLIVRVGQRSMRLKEISELTPGRILELNKPADDELDLLVNNVAIGQGQAVKVGENFGVSISFIGDVKARIEALGGAPVVASTPIADAQIDDDEASALADQFLAG